MPAPKLLSNFKKDLQELLTQDLAAALNALKEKLEGCDSSHYEVILSLKGRLNDANKERFRNLLSPDEYQRRLSEIRAVLLDVISELEDDDIQRRTDAAPVPGAAAAARQGSVLYRVPQQMPLQIPSICTVRVALETDALLEDIELDESTHVYRAAGGLSVLSFLGVS